MPCAELHWCSSLVGAQETTQEQCVLRFAQKVMEKEKHKIHL